MKNHAASRSLRTTAVALLPVISLLPAPASAALIYWDLNGPAPGAGAIPSGTWDSASPNWNPDPNGEGAGPVVWTENDTAVFSAGTDAIDAFVVGVTLNRAAAGIIIQEGSVSINLGAGGSFNTGVNIGSGSVIVSPGTTLSTDSSFRIQASTGATYFVDGATLKTTNTGNAGSFVDIDATITLGAGGGIVHNDGTALNIIQTTTIVSGPGSLTKNGAGLIAIASPSTYEGSTTVNDGEFRIRFNHDRLPTTTALTVNSPGILNLNGLNQRVGSLSGDGSIGLGNGTLTVGNANDTSFTGDIADVRTIGGGVTTGNGKLTKVGTGELVLAGTNTYTGTFTLNEGRVTVAPTGTLAGDICDVVVNAGVLEMLQPAQTIRNLNGTGGTIILGPGHTFSVTPGSDSTYAGSINGSGSLTKFSAFSQTLSGTNTYSGATTIAEGTLVVTGALTGTSVVDVGGTLGGSGTITVAPGGSLSVIPNGKLAPGTGPGNLTVKLSGGGKVDVGGAIITPNSQALLFELGAAASTDKVTISGGSLDIGVGLLEFDDFAFTTLAGFDPSAIADYVLFDGDTPINGSLGLNRIGLVGGADAELMLGDGGNDLILHVIPEPASATLLLGGLGLLARRRRQPGSSRFKS